MLLYLAVKKLFFILLLILILAPSVASAQGDEFYIVTDGPVAVGGGMFRHYIHSSEGLVSSRYSFQGVIDNNICVEKVTRSTSPDSSYEKELIKIPLKQKGPKQARFDIGTRAVKLKLNKYNRVIIKEVK